MDALQIKLCDIQGRLFELSGKNGLNSAEFIKVFMHSEIAKNLDSTYNQMQWMGEEYLLEALIAEHGDSISKTAEVFPAEVLYWIGYIYRYWHFYTDEDSAKIFKQASVAIMKRNYMMFHTLDPEVAVDDLKEIYRQKSGGSIHED